MSFVTHFILRQDKYGIQNVVGAENYDYLSHFHLQGYLKTKHPHLHGEIIMRPSKLTDFLRSFYPRILTSYMLCSGLFCKVTSNKTYNTTQVSKKMRLINLYFYDKNFQSNT
jgi:hypothetical protein